MFHNTIHVVNTDKFTCNWAALLISVKVFILMITQKVQYIDKHAALFYVKWNSFLNIFVSQVDKIKVVYNIVNIVNNVGSGCLCFAIEEDTSANYCSNNVIASNGEFT